MLKDARISKHAQLGSIRTILVRIKLGSYYYTKESKIVNDMKRMDRNNPPQNWILHSFVSRDNFCPRRFTQTD